MLEYNDPAKIKTRCQICAYVAQITKATGCVPLAIGITEENYEELKKDYAAGSFPCPVYLMGSLIIPVKRGK